MAEADRTIHLHNIGSVDVWVSTEIQGQFAGFYTDNMTLDGVGATAYQNAMQPGDDAHPVAQITVPLGTPAGAKTATIVFWAEAVIE